MSYTVQINSVRKAYGDFVAVNGISFQIPQGSVYGLLGPNGAGKTSTIRMMIGITMPDSGSVELFGEPFRREHLQRIGYLPEERGLYKKMKVLDHLVFLGELHGMTAAGATTQARVWAERLKIAEKLNNKIEELSKGMQQKIQFIGALLHDPEFVILDEPFSGLDPLNTDLLKEVILDLRRGGKTILFSSHQMNTVEMLCDSICLVNRGEVVLEGPLKAIKSRYGRNNVQIEYEGGEFAPKEHLVQAFNHHGKYIEVRLAPGVDTQELLREVAQRARVHRFEVVEPSLHEIFVEVVGRSNA